MQLRHHFGMFAIRLQKNSTARMQRSLRHKYAPGSAQKGVAQQKNKRVQD